MNAIELSLLLKKHLHIIYETSPSLLLSHMFFDAYFSCLFWRQKTRIFRGSLFFFIAHSSEHNILRQSFTVQCWYILTHVNHCLACFLFIKDLSTILHFLILASCNQWWRVCSEILLIISTYNFVRGILILRFAVCTI